MPNGDEQKRFRTLRGFLRGEEPDEATFFKYSAILRVHGENVPFGELASRLGVQPTHMHRKGERRGPRSPAYQDDAWQYQPSLPPTDALYRHIDALWEVVRPHVNFLKSLKGQYKVDVSCGYQSNSDTAGFEVPHTSLVMFAELEVPFGVSVIVA